MLKQALFNSVEELLPHQGEIILITDILDWGENWLCAIVDHSRPSIFSMADGSVPAWVGIEYMAQAIGALLGIRAIETGQEVRIGFLIGTKKYECSVPNFTSDMKVTVKVKEAILERTNIAVFDCEIIAGEVLATARIKAVRPKDPKTALKA